MSATDSHAKYLSVSELVTLLDLTLQEQIGELVFIGEVNQVTYAQSGHVYFSLKDEDGKVDAVMWQGLARGLKFRIETGVVVICQARPNVYKRSGKLQMVATRLELFGEGLLQKKFNELKEKLEKEGFFDISRKRKLPLLPRAVGIISSKDGAVIHDIMHRVQARMPCIPTYLIDVRVQGPGAAAEIVRAIQEFNRLASVDVIILARGGGSLEDLWSFNEEQVVRAIFASKIPIVSGVGHETDVTLADFVADLRAPTPTAAAELVVPSFAELNMRIENLAKRLVAYDRWLQPAWQAVDELSLRLNSALTLMHARYENRIEKIKTRLKIIEPHNLLVLLRQKLEASRLRLNTASLQKINLANSRLDALSNKLETLNHIKLLKRGYTILQDNNGQLLKSVSELEIGKDLVLNMSDGKARAEVLDISVATGTKG